MSSLKVDKDAPRTRRPSVAKPSAESQCTTALRNYILSGTVRPGDRLKEVHLSETLQVSRSTLRTSLMKLTAEGIVVQIPFTGWQVMTLTPDDVWELWTLRAGLESLASKLVAERMTPEIAHRIERAVDDLSMACASGSLHEANDKDFRLHRTIIDLVGNRRLSGQYQHVEQQVRYYLVFSNELVGTNLKAIVEQHTAMIEALLSRDPTRAAQEAYRHNESEGGKLAAAIRRQHKSAAGGSQERLIA